MQRTNGFTLIELLVVVGLLGIIIAAVLANMNSAKRKAYDTVAMSCAQDIARKEKIVQTRHESYQAFELLPDTSVCQPLVAMDAAPFGSAEELNFAYEVRHPRGVATYTVTDSEIYENGVSRTGALLTDDPAAPLVLSAGGPFDPGGPVGPAATLESCVASGMGVGTLLQGDLDSGGFSVTQAVDYGAGLQITEEKQYTRLSHNVVALQTTRPVMGTVEHTVMAFMNGTNITTREVVPTAPSAGAINLPGLGVLSAAQWETEVLNQSGLSAPDPGIDRAQAYLSLYSGMNGGPAYCRNATPI